MIGYVLKPLHMTRIALVVRLPHAAAEHDPFEHSALVDHKNITNCLDVGDAVRNIVDSVKIGDRFGIIDLAAVVAERLRGAGIQENTARYGFKGMLHGLLGDFQGFDQGQEQLSI